MTTVTEQAAIDSNVLVALIDGRDKWHGEAQALLAVLKGRDTGPVYFDCVLNETISVLARRAEEQGRLAQFPMLLSLLLSKVPKEIVVWISGETQRLYDDIVDLVRESTGKLNFHDALIALSCRELGIKTIASFDEDFDDVLWLRRVKISS